jgi:UDP-glucose 4-epimerase
VRDYLYVEDLASLCVEAVYSGKVGVYNGGSGQGASIREIIDNIEQVTGKLLNPVFKPARPVDVPRSVLDVTRAMTDFGWSCTTGLQEGIRRSWDFLANGQDTK